MPTAQIWNGGAWVEIQAAASAHDHSGTSVANTPAGNIAATTVQAALNELDSEKETAGVCIPKSLVDAAGDLLVGTANDTVGRLALGTALYVLRVNAAGTALEFAAASGGSAVDSDQNVLANRMFG